MLRIEAVPGGYLAEVGPPEADETWSSPKPLPVLGLAQELRRIGCQAAHITEAFEATGTERRKQSQDVLAEIVGFPSFAQEDRADGGCNRT